MRRTDETNGEKIVVGKRRNKDTCDVFAGQKPRSVAGSVTSMFMRFVQHTPSSARTRFTHARE